MKRKRTERVASVPLGVDIGTELVSIVAAEASSDGFAVRETATLEVPDGDGLTLDLRIAETARRILSGFRTKERRCVIGSPPGETITRTFRVPPGMRRREAERAAELDAGTVVDWPASERLVALDAIPRRTDEMLLSIARHSAVARLVAIARAGGLRAIAVDNPTCAWRRAVPDADAVLDLAGERAQLIIFGDPVGSTQLFAPRLIDERLASQVRGAFADARRDGIADVQRLSVVGTRFRYESLAELLRDGGHAVAPARLGGLEAPTWTFAYGLATWSVAPLGLRAS